MDKLRDKYKFNYKSSNYGLMYTALLLGEVEESYTYFKLIPANEYTNIIKYIFGYIFNVDEEDREEIKHFQLNDLNPNDNIITPEILLAIYNHHFTYAYISLCTSIENNKASKLFKEDIFLKNICKIAKEIRKNNFDLLNMFIDQGDIKTAKELLLSIGKSRPLNQREIKYYYLFLLYEEIEKGIIPKIKNDVVMDLSSALLANNFILAYSYSKISDPNLHKMIKIIIKKICEVQKIDDYKLNEYKEKIQSAKDNKESILLDDLSLDDQMILCQLLDEETDVFIYQLGTEINKRYCLVNRIEFESKEFHNYCKLADKDYYEERYDIALENYKMAICCIGRPVFNIFNKIAKCHTRLGNQEIADNYFMMNYYQSFNNKNPYRTQRRINNQMLHNGSRLKNKAEFYESLARLLLMGKESFENLECNLYLTNKDKTIISLFGYYILYCETKDVAFLRVFECVKSENNDDIVKKYIKYLEEKIYEFESDESRKRN